MTPHFTVIHIIGDVYSIGLELHQAHRQYHLPIPPIQIFNTIRLVYISAPL